MTGKNKNKLYNPWKCERIQIVKITANWNMKMYCFFTHRHKSCLDEASILTFAIAIQTSARTKHFTVLHPYIIVFQSSNWIICLCNRKKQSALSTKMCFVLKKYCLYFSNIKLLFYLQIFWVHKWISSGKTTGFTILILPGSSNSITILKKKQHCINNKVIYTSKS